MTMMQIFYPIILMLICYLIKLAFNSTKVTWEEEGDMDKYLIDKGNFGFDYKVYAHLTRFTHLLKQGKLESYSDFNTYFTLVNVTDNNLKLLLIDRISNILMNLSPSEGIWKYIDPLDETHDISVSTIVGLPVKPLTMICYNRFLIALIGFKETDELGIIIKSYISIEMTALNRTYGYISFNNVEELNEYVKAENFGKAGRPAICFGIYFKKKEIKNMKLRFIISTMQFNMVLKTFLII